MAKRKSNTRSDRSESLTPSTLPMLRAFIDELTELTRRAEATQKGDNDVPKVSQPVSQRGQGVGFTFTRKSYALRPRLTPEKARKLADNLPNNDRVCLLAIVGGESQSDAIERRTKLGKKAVESSLWRLRRVWELVVSK